MIDESLQEQAALYASGAMSAREREQFDLILSYHPDLRALVAELEEVTAAAIASTDGPRPCPALKARLLGMVEKRAQDRPERHAGFVIASPEGLVQWVNPAFTEMCGYTLEEVRDHKLGPILQGEKTDPGAAERMRRAVHACQPCVETILNYRKDGSPYWVEIAITPIIDDAGEPHWLVAHERELPEPVSV